jgi:hypothetical protein
MRMDVMIIGTTAVTTPAVGFDFQPIAALLASP